MVVCWWASGLASAGTSPDSADPARGAPSMAELAPVGFEINFRVGGVFVTLGGRSFPGCTLKVSRLDAKGAKGSLTCPRPPPSGVGAIEFSVAP